MKKTMAAGVALGLGVLTACGGGAGGSGEDRMTFVSWGGEGQDLQEQLWTDPFGEENGIRVLQDGPTDYAKIQAMVEADNVTWDVVQVDTSVAVNECGNLFEKIDTDAVDMSQIDDSVVFTECGLPVLQQGLVMVYNTDKFGDNPPTSIEDYFDLEKYPGKRGMFNNSTPGQYELALMADGVAAEDLYPLDVDRALDKIGSIRKNISWYATTAQSTEQLNSGSVAMSLVYSGRAYTAVKDGAPYAPVWSTGMRATDQLVIPKGATNKGAAEKFLNYMATADPQVALSEVVPYAPTVTGVEVDADEVNQQFSPADPDNIGSTTVINQVWWGANVDAVDEAWTAWQAG